MVNVKINLCLLIFLTQNQTEFKALFTAVHFQLSI